MFTNFFKNRKNKLSFEKMFQDHIETSLKSARNLVLLFKKMPDTNNYMEEIIALEREGDNQTKNIYDLLNKVFITRIDKSDIEKLAQELDDITDGIRDVVHYMRSYNIKKTTKEAIELSLIITSMIEVLKQITDKMPNLNNGFMKEGINKIKELEEKADDLLEKARGRAFKQYEIKLFLAWKDIYEKLEGVTNHCFHVMLAIDSICRKGSF